ncbi:glucan phosphoethanolaminetransferase (alkaline phosphatase superfamily) [Dysgonomonas hofstadii]|uniref:Glucan phosphoethanolaminetransferase (Alkaline phosphatase superfamily) n=1 Tax=Dysgonomonas hofstadii TaxID=637886 RepID=A0A840CXC9_9BACT|nr:hypothetical protein [Dysgonomonas hofstadii]MBB4036543.1 glucan phosphoethanolaminetransferase (alkaline phosphatase superfamily) [Dysgonomonas hofstadii]
MSDIYYYICKKARYMSDYLRHIFEHASSQGYKSNVVKSLFGLLSILLTATILLFKIGENVFGYILGCLSVLIVLAFLFAYFYCLFKDPNLLRSEKFVLEKTAIEKALMSDSIKKTVSVNPPNSNYVSYGSIEEEAEK